MKDKKFDNLIDITKRVENYQRELKPFTKSTRLKSNFFGDQKKSLDELNKQIQFYNNETKKQK